MTTTLNKKKVLDSSDDTHIAECNYCKHRDNQPKFMPFSQEELFEGLAKSKSIKEYDKRYGWYCPKCKKKIECLNIVGTDKEMLAIAMQTTCATCEKLHNCPLTPNSIQGMICSFYKRAKEEIVQR